MENYITTLGVNIDHVASLRQARHTPYPDLRKAIAEAEAGGADGITMHLREDRRHIQDADVYVAREHVTTHLNLEMAATTEMVEIALRVKPDYCCLVPEQREELTTEGGLDIDAHRQRIAEVCETLHGAGIAVSLFIEPELSALEAAVQVGAKIVELHTGEYAGATDNIREQAYQRIVHAARHGTELGLQVNAGHGLTLDNVGPIAAIPQICELNIGHAIVADAVFIGLKEAVREFKKTLQASNESLK